MGQLRYRYTAGSYTLSVGTDQGNAAYRKIQLKVDTTDGAVTINLPSIASLMAKGFFFLEIIGADFASNFATSNCIITPNAADGDKINGAASVTLSTNNTNFILKIMDENRWGLFTDTTATNSGVKRYKAIITQTSTNAPTAVVLENTIGTITFGYTSVGVYSINSSALFTLNKTTALYATVSQDAAYGILVDIANATSSLIPLKTDISTPSNGVLNKTTILIEVYP